MSKVSIAIVAGGKSSRMGKDKSFVEILGKPMIEHVLARINSLGQAETLLITNNFQDYAYLGLPMYEDVLPDKGSLGGIYTALHYSSSPYTLVIACDMPFVDGGLVRHMMVLGASDEFDVIVPRVKNYPQGLHAIYSKGCLAPIRQKLDEDRLKVILFYDEVRVRYLDEPEYQPWLTTSHALLNVNTPDDLAKAQTIIDTN